MRSTEMHIGRLHTAMRKLYPTHCVLCSGVVVQVEKPAWGNAVHGVIPAQPSPFLEHLTLFLAINLTLVVPVFCVCTVGRSASSSFASPIPSHSNAKPFLPRILPEPLRLDVLRLESLCSWVTPTIYRM